MDPDIEGCCLTSVSVSLLSHAQSSVMAALSTWRVTELVFSFVKLLGSHSSGGKEILQL